MYDYVWSYICVHKQQQTLVNNNLRYNAYKASYTTLKEIIEVNWNRKKREVLKQF